MTTQIRLALVIVFLLGLAGSHWYVFGLGKTVEEASWLKKEATRKIWEDKARADEEIKNAIIRSQQEETNRKVGVQHANEIANIRTEFERSHSRLRLSSAICNSVTPATKTNTSNESNTNSAGTIELPEEIGRNLRQLARDADEVTATARGLQTFAKACSN